MFLEQLATYSEQLGIAFTIYQTKHPEWKRAFIVKNGVTLGRISVQDRGVREEIYIKDYRAKWSGIPIREDDFLFAQIHYLAARGLLLTKEELFESFLALSAVITARYLQHVEEREKLPKRKRKALKLPDYRNNFKYRYTEYFDRKYFTV